MYPAQWSDPSPLCILLSGLTRRSPELRQRNTDFEGEAALFSVFTGLNQQVCLFWRGGDLCG